MTRSCQTVLIIPDVHTQWSRDKNLWWDRRYWKAVHRYMSDSRFDEIVFLGDFLDMPGLARFSVGKAKILSELDLEGDYQVAAELLYKTVDILRKNNRNAKVTFLQGNHEQRVERFAEEVPQFSRLLSVPTQLEFKANDIKWVQCYNKGELHRIGPLYFHHGLYCGKHPATQHVDKFNRDIVFGHTHSVSTYTKVLYGTDRTYTAHNLGCACLLEQEYMHGRPDNWQQAFGVAWVRPKEKAYNLATVRVTNHEFVAPNGKLYSGRKT